MITTMWEAVSNGGKFYVMRNDDTGEPELALDARLRYRIFRTLTGARKAANRLNKGVE